MCDDQEDCLYSTVTDIFVWFFIGLLTVVTTALIIITNNKMKRFKSLLCASNSAVQDDDQAPYCTPTRRSYKDSEHLTPVDDCTDDCAICMCPMTQPKKLPCGHWFCRDCIQQAFTKCQPKCPTCGYVCGEMTGNQPRGQMTTDILPSSLAGYDDTRLYAFPTTFLTATRIKLIPIQVRGITVPIDGLTCPTTTRVKKSLSC